MVRVTAWCGRPMAVQTSGRLTIPCTRRPWSSLLLWVVFRSKAACAASPRAAAALEDATDTSRAALRPGSAAVVKISAGVDVASVDPHGSVVTPEPASFQASEQRVCTRVVASRGFGSAASFFHVPAASPGMLHTDDTRRPLCSSDGLIVFTH